MKAKRILCICTMGTNRSKYLAKYLNQKGYKTRFGGVGPCKFDPMPKNPLNPKDLAWADLIIVVRKKHISILKEKFKVKNKEIINLEVLDSQKKISKRYPKLKNIPREEFNRKWTYLQLEKAIKKYLPLNIG